ncbi:MAG: MbnP family protein [Rhodothermales bacterium]
MTATTYFRSGLIALILITFAACDTTVQDDEPAAVNFDLEAVFNGTPLIADGVQQYTLNGRTLTIASARMYLSGITLVKEDGTEHVLLAETPLTTVAKLTDGTDVAHTVDEEIVLVKHDASISSYHLGDVDPGTYKGFKVTMGIGGLSNNVDASQIPETHPLGIQTDRNNHWSWNAGYIFLRLDGLVDADGDGTPESQWDVHLGTPMFLNTMTFDQEFELGPGSENDLHVIIDYAAFLGDLDYSDPTQHICHTMNNIPVAEKVSAKTPEAFDFHGVHVLSGDHTH